MNDRFEIIDPEAKRAETPTIQNPGGENSFTQQLLALRGQIEKSSHIGIEEGTRLTGMLDSATKFAETREHPDVVRETINAVSNRISLAHALRKD